MCTATLPLVRRARRRTTKHTKRGDNDAIGRIALDKLLPSSASSRHKRGYRPRPRGPEEGDHVETGARREYVVAISGRYHAATRREKGRILDEFCQVTGYHRKSALRRLHGGPPTGAARRRGRPVQYGPLVAPGLREIWTAAGYPWSVRLKALMPLWLPWARRRLRLSAAVCVLLQGISPRQIDRVLRPVKRTLKTRRYGRTKPGTLLKHHIPLKTDRWDVAVPGFTELDLVAHNGSRSDGEFAHSLNVTDVHTTWNETQAVLGRGRWRCKRPWRQIRQALPFRLRGIDTDNGSEFINDHLYRYCQRLEIQFTRGRPYKKGRQCPHRAEELDPCPQGRGLSPLRPASRGDGPQ
jgi:hypothetical protein